MYTSAYTQACFKGYTAPLTRVAVSHTEHVFTAHIGIQKYTSR